MPSKLTFSISFIVGYKWLLAGTKNKKEEAAIQRSWPRSSSSHAHILCSSCWINPILLSVHCNTSTLLIPLKDGSLEVRLLCFCCSLILFCFLFLVLVCFTLGLSKLLLLTRTLHLQLAKILFPVCILACFILIWQARITLSLL